MVAIKNVIELDRWLCFDDVLAIQIYSEYIDTIPYKTSCEEIYLVLNLVFYFELKLIICLNSVFCLVFEINYNIGAFFSNLQVRMFNSIQIKNFQYLSAETWLQVLLFEPKLWYPCSI